MKAIKTITAIVLAIILLVLQTALLALFAADRLIAPRALTEAISGAGLMRSIVEDTLGQMGLDASNVDAAPLDAYAGKLAASTVNALVRDGRMPTVDSGELTKLMTGVLAPALQATEEEAGALSALLCEQLAAQLNSMLSSRAALAVAIPVAALTALEMLFSPMARILLSVAVLLFGFLLVLLLGKRRRVGRTGLVWWSITAALAGCLILLCGAGLDAALRSALDADTAQFVNALQRASGGAFILIGAVGLAMCAVLLIVYFSTKPKRRRRSAEHGVRQRYA